MLTPASASKTRLCPNCNAVIHYSSTLTLRRAEKSKAQCSKCRRWNQNGTWETATLIKYYHAQGLNDTEIAKKVGKTKASVHYMRVNHLGLECNRLLTDYEREQNKRQIYDIRWACRQRIAEIKVRVREINVPFRLTAEHLLVLWEMQEGCCFYTDLPMAIRKPNGQQSNAMSVDRVVPELGYVEGNVVLCQNRINISKSTITLAEMETWMPDWFRRVSLLYPELVSNGE